MFKGDDLFIKQCLTSKQSLFCVFDNKGPPSHYHAFWVDSTREHMRLFSQRYMDVEKSFYSFFGLYLAR